MPNMRLVLIQGIVGGIALAILIMAIVLQYLVNVLPSIQTGIFITYLVSVCCLIFLVFLSVVSTFFSKAFIHPDDRLWGNTFCFVLFMADTLALGHFFPSGVAVNEVIRKFSYEAGSYVLITFILIYLVLFFSKKIGFHEIILGDPNKREKEIVARFILFSILLGAILVSLKYLLDIMYGFVNYTGGVWIMMISSFGIIMLIAFTNWKKYAPVADAAAEKKP
jgi:hypothetical protein